MKFFIKVCVLFNARMQEGAGVMHVTLQGFLAALERTAEYLGDNESEVFLECAPVQSGFGGLRYPHEQIVARFLEACGKNTSMLLADNPIWRSIVGRRRPTDYRSDSSVAAFTDQLIADLPA